MWKIEDTRHQPQVRDRPQQQQSLRRPRSNSRHLHVGHFSADSEDSYSSRQSHSTSYSPSSGDERQLYEDEMLDREVNVSRERTSSRGAADNHQGGIFQRFFTSFRAPQQPGPSRRGNANTINIILYFCYR